MCFERMGKISLFDYLKDLKFVSSAFTMLSVFSKLASKCGLLHWNVMLGLT
jgi:hypothetical protein